MAIRVLLVDDHTVFRDCLGRAFDAEPGFSIEGEAADGRTAVKMARQLEPDVVAMDIVMPELNGIEATRQIVEMDSGARVLALSTNHDVGYVQQMLRAGATGYLTKRCPVAELFAAARAIAEGKSYLSQDIADLVLADYSGAGSANGGGNGNGNGGAHHLDAIVTGSPEGRVLIAEHLSTREREVLQLIAEGHATKAIAVHLCLSAKTVESHRARLMRKLNIHNIADLTKFAIREGLTTLEA